MKQAILKILIIGASQLIIINPSNAQEGGAGKIQPIIAIIPDGNNSFFINNQDQSVPWEDFFVKEFIPAMDEKYRTKANRESRAIVGISMGGFGTLVYLLKHPDLFIYGLAYSPAIMSEGFINSISIDDWNDGFDEAFGKAKTSEDRFGEHYQHYSPIHLVKNYSIESLKNVKLVNDCGKDDFLADDNMAFHTLLDSLQIKHEYVERKGGHGWEYWKSGINSNLIKLSKCLN